jgi:hypothetical protein
VLIVQVVHIREVDWGHHILVEPRKDSAVVAHTHIQAAYCKAAPRRGFVVGELRMDPAAVDILHRDSAEVECRKGLAEVEPHKDSEVFHTQSMGPGWGSESCCFSLLILNMHDTSMSGRVALLL